MRTGMFQMLFLRYKAITVKMTSRNQQFRTVQQEGLDLFTRKNRDYGDAFADYGVVGVLVRMGDKIRRLQNISNTGVTLVQDESFRDTLIDLHNYAAMAVLLLDSNENMDSSAEEKGAEEVDNVIVNASVSTARSLAPGDAYPEVPNAASQTFRLPLLRKGIGFYMG